MHVSTALRGVTTTIIGLALTTGPIIGCGNQPTVQSHSTTLASSVVETGNDDYQLIASLLDDGGKWQFTVKPRRPGTTDSLRFEWDFGDNRVYTGAQQTYSFQESGWHRVTVIGLDSRDTLVFVLTLDVEIPHCNQPPTVLLIEALTVDANQMVFLDGSATYDLDEDPLTFAWTQIAGDLVQLTDADAPVASFVTPMVDEETRLVFNLEVSDGANSVQASVTVDVMPLLGPAGGDLPGCIFTLSAADNPDPSQPYEGQRPLTGTWTVANLDGLPIPYGMLTWVFDGVAESGTVDTHSVRNHTFNTTGVHTVALALAASGMMVGCKSSLTGTEEETVTVWPMISGQVHDEIGAAISDVTVSANLGGTASVTDNDGFYKVHIPFDWSGQLTAQHIDYDFDQQEKSYANIRDDVQRQNMFGLLRGKDPPTASCATDADCADGAYCNGIEQCVLGVCTSGSDPCSPLPCDEQYDVCGPAYTVANLPLDMQGTPPESSDVLLTLNEIPSGTTGIELVLTVFDAENADEGHLIVNGLNSILLFGASAEDANDATTVTLDPISTPVSSYQLGENTLTFWHDSTNGYVIEGISLNFVTSSGCTSDGECDDGLYCNGAESCVSGACESSGNPCAPGETCDEIGDTCVPQQQDCLDDSDCADGLYCNGAETCLSGSCVAGANPCSGQGCDEINDVCVEVGVYFMSPGGSDSDDGSFESPWQTIGHAKSRVSAGDTIYMRGGTYFLSSGIIWHPDYNSNGTAANPITLRGYPGESVVIDGQGNVSYLFQIYNLTQWWVFEQFEMRNASVSCVELGWASGSDRPKDLVFRNIRGRATGDSVFTIFESDRITMENCTATDGNNGFIVVDTNLVSLINCVAHDVRQDGFNIVNTAVNTSLTGCMAYACGDAGFDIGGNTTLMDCVSWNIHSPSSSEGVGYKLWDSQKRVAGGRITMLRCIAYDCKATGIWAGVRHSSSAGGGGGDNLVDLINCTVADSKINIHISTESDQGYVTRATIWNTISSHATDQGAGGQRRALKVESTCDLVAAGDNLWHRNPSDGSEIILYHGTEYSADDIDNGSWTATTGLGAGSFSADPAYIDFANGNFALSTTSPISPCVNAGTDLGFPFVGSAPDLGAIESDVP